MANRSARNTVKKAVDCGKLPHISGLTCVDCGEQAKHYDHRDYNKPLDVDPVCVKCNFARGSAKGTHDLNNNIVVNIPAKLLKKAKTEAEKIEMSFSHWLITIINLSFKENIIEKNMGNIISENLLKTLYVIYKSPTGEVTRSDMTRGMIQRKLKDPVEREQLIQEARKQKLLAVGRKIQMDKGGQNPIIYKITKLGMDIIAPFVGDEDLAEHEK